MTTLSSAERRDLRPSTSIAPVLPRPAAYARPPQARIPPAASHLTALGAALERVCLAGGDHAAVLAGRADLVLHGQDFFRHARPLPLSGIAGRAGVFRRAG